jgi:hypothetical protein
VKKPLLVLLIVAALAFVSAEQDAVIAQQKALIQLMRTDPRCMTSQK